MGNDAVLRTCLAWLAAAIVLTGLCTHSWKKMAATYWFGMLAVCGVVLPDWKFFDRPVSQWCSLVTADDVDDDVRRGQPAPARFKLYPVRLVIYAAIYGFGLHKWWSFITS